MTDGIIQKYADRFITRKETLMERLREAGRPDYADLFRMTIEAIREDEWYDPDPERIAVIDHGDDQGTLLLVVADGGYQPSDFWAVTVFYGSCSHCDTLEGIFTSYPGPPRAKEEVTADLWTLCLHMVQGLRKLDLESV